LLPIARIAVLKQRPDLLAGNSRRIRGRRGLFELLRPGRHAHGDEYEGVQNSAARDAIHDAEYRMAIESPEVSDSDCWPFRRRCGKALTLWWLV
jgi:hypothetical protein